MEIKAKLDKPYTEEQRINFIVEQNHQRGYEIRETQTALQAWGLTEEEQKQADLENKQKSVRAVREQYFIEFVDWYQSKPLLWDEMTEEEKKDIADYRKYLMDYTKEESWWEQNPLTFEEWKNELA